MMENSIRNNYGKCKIKMSKKSAQELKKLVPRGCPFPNYSLFDLLNDFIESYYWKICGCGEVSLSDFIRKLQSENYDKAIAYGDAMIAILN